MCFFFSKFFFCCCCFFSKGIFASSFGAARRSTYPWDVLGVWQEDAEVHQFLRREEMAYPESHVEEDEEDNDAITYSRDDGSLKSNLSSLLLP